MASIDGSKSLLAASDELPVNTCGPCKSEGNVKQARHYCPDCSEYLCEPCERYHRKFALTKGHKTIPANMASVSQSANINIYIYCDCNKKQDVKFFCEGHSDVMCNSCKNIKHHKCETYPISQKCSGYTGTNFESVVSKVKSLKDKFNEMKQNYSVNGKELNISKEACQKEIQAFRKKIGTFLDTLEKNMLAELDKLTAKEHQHIGRQNDGISSAIQMLEADIQMLNDAKKSENKDTMFTAEIRVSKYLSDYVSRLGDFENDFYKLSLAFEIDKKLDDLEKETKSFGSLRVERAKKENSNVKPSLLFEKDKEFRDLETDMKSFGTLTVERAKNENRNATVLLGRKVQSRRKVNVKLGGDKNMPKITGCAVMPSGHIVVCDQTNKRLKLFDASFVFTAGLAMPSSICDLSVIDPSNIVVTFPEQKRLQFIQVFPDLKLRDHIQLDKKCWGVHVAKEDIYVSCYNHSSNGEVNVVDKYGNQKRRLGFNKDGSFMFYRPDYITVSTSGDKIFVSNSKTDSVICMTTVGHVIYQYKNLRDPRGLLCDDEDNILVCGSSTNTVQVIAANGKDGYTLVSSADGLNEPHSIAFRKTDDTLIVGGNGQLLVFKF